MKYRIKTTRFVSMLGNVVSRHTIQTRWCFMWFNTSLYYDDYEEACQVLDNLNMLHNAKGEEK